MFLAGSGVLTTAFIASGSTPLLDRWLPFCAFLLLVGLLLILFLSMFLNSSTVCNTSVLVLYLVFYAVQV